MTPAGWTLNKDRSAAGPADRPARRGPPPRLPIERGEIIDPRAGAGWMTTVRRPPATTQPAASAGHRRGQFLSGKQAVPPRERRPGRQTAAERLCCPEGRGGPAASETVAPGQTRCHAQVQTSGGVGGGRTVRAKVGGRGSAGAGARRPDMPGAVTTPCIDLSRPRRTKSDAAP